MLSQEPYAPIDRTKLSKALIDDAEKVQWRTPEELKNDFGVDLHLSTTVTHVDTEGQKVTTQDGKEYKYDKLVLSPGAVPKKIPIEGKDLEGVITMRHISDIKQITSALGPETDVVVIGTSFIGLEAAGSISGKEFRTLTVVGVDEVPFEAMLGKDLGMALVKHFESKGVKFHRGVQVEKIAPKEGTNRVGALHVKGLDPIPATIVLMGTGVAPATDFMKGHFVLQKDGGVVVDKYLRVEGKQNVFAIGDIAHYPQFPHGNVRRVEHWNVAGNHGRTVGRTIATPDDPMAYEQAPIFWSSIGKGLRYISKGLEFDDQYLDGSADELKFVLYQAKGDEITTVASMGRDPVVAKSNELLRTQRMPKLSEIKGGLVGCASGHTLTAEHPRPAVGLRRVQGCTVRSQESEVRWTRLHVKPYTGKPEGTRFCKWPPTAWCFHLCFSQASCSDIGSRYMLHELCGMSTPTNASPPPAPPLTPANEPSPS